MKVSKDTSLTLFTFLLFVIVFYILGYWLIFRMGQATPLMLSVGLATIATCSVRRIKLDSLGWAWGEWKYQWMSYLTPLIIGFISYLIIWVADFGDFYNVEFLLKQKSKYNLMGWSDFSVSLFHIILVGSINFIISFPSVLGEEIGWRGLLFNELSKSMTFRGVALISGIAWSIFHWPLILKGLYGNNVTPIYFQLVFFSLFIVSTAVIMTYIRMKSGSLWTAVVYHASSNIFIQKVFTPITLKNEKSFWYIDEFGAILAIVTCASAIYFWGKGIDEFNK